MKKFFRALLAFLIISVLTFGCLPKKEEAKTEKKEPYRIGAVLSVTGPAAPLGEPEKKTLLMEVEKINKAGGIDGHEIELYIEDDETDPGKAVAAVKKLIDQKRVIAVIGGSITPSTLAMKEITKKKRIPQVACAAGNAIVASDYEWVFITPQSNAIVVPKVLEYIRDTLKLKKVAFLYDSDAFGRDGLEVLQKEAPNYGVEVVITQDYSKKAGDLTPQLTKIKAASPEVLVVWGTNPGPAVAAKNMKQLGMNIPYIGSHGIANKKFIELAGDAAEGVVFPAGKVIIPESISEDSPQKKVVDEFLKEYEDRYGEPPNSFAGHAWDAFHIIVEALKKSGPDPEKLRDEIEKTTNFPGIGGIFNYTSTDHAGLSVDDLIMVKIENGEWTLAE